MKIFQEAEESRRQSLFKVSMQITKFSEQFAISYGGSMLETLHFITILLS